IADADDPFRIVTQLRDAVVSGSYLALSHVAQAAEQDERLVVVRQMSQQTSTPWQPRSREQIARLLDGLDLVEPGIVPVTDWRPDPSDEGASQPWPYLFLVAVGRKP